VTANVPQPHDLPQRRPCVDRDPARNVPQTTGRAETPAAPRVTLPFCKLFAGRKA